MKKTLRDSVLTSVIFFTHKAVLNSAGTSINRSVYNPHHCYDPILASVYNSVHKAVYNYIKSK